MKIALVGKNEKLQGVLAAECVKRGMTVTQGLPSAEDLKTVDAVVTQMLRYLILRSSSFQMVKNAVRMCHRPDLKS